MSPAYALILAGITISTYIFGRLMDATDNDRRKNQFKIINIVLIILPLLFYKYFTAINLEVFRALEGMHIRYPLPDVAFLLPVGISFYTFMAIGYTVDVYNEEIPAEKNLGILALFISFFPLVLSGPIERAGNMLPQFNSEKKLDPNNVSKGLKMMLWGYFMKLVIADRLAIYIDAVYADIPAQNGTTLTLAAILYPFQVYADLGGYSLIAIGASKIMGFDVMQNFRRPFFATSMSDFWRRWHISLISWITDYIYTPLSFHFRKYGKWGIVISLYLAFLLSGIWHGAALTFIAWGLLQGTYLSVEALTVKQRADFRLKHNLSKNVVFITLSILLIFFLFAASQIFGRATSFNNAIDVFGKIATNHGAPYIDMPTLAIGLPFLAILLLSDFRDEFHPQRFLLFNNRRFGIRFLSYLFIFIATIFFGVVSDEFIYFKF
jgi:D-alanyl-lipoteichoic acid acyltransferase DltB (MBOAT superfamily)